MTNENLHFPAGNGNSALVVQTIEGEARIRDLDLAVRLGFADPHKIRALIERHKAALEALGISATVAEIPQGRGRPGKAHFLNRKQAIFITAKSETPTATDITIEIIERFDAYERGGRAAIPDLSDPVVLTALLMEHASKRIEAERRADTAERHVAEIQPKAAFYDQFVNADGLYGLQNAGRVLKQGPNKFVSYLKQGYMFYQGGELLPKAQYRDRGLFEVKATLVDDKSRLRAYITPRGIQFFAQKLGVTLDSDLFQPQAAE